MNKYLVLFILSLTLSSCYYENEEELYGIYECDENIPSYSGELEAVIYQNCAEGTGCHNPDGHHPDLTTLKNIQDKSIAMLKRIQNGTMPKQDSYYALTDEQKQKIYCWINAGSPDN